MRRILQILLIVSCARTAGAQSESLTVFPQSKHPLAVSATRADLESLAKDLQRVAQDSATSAKDREEYQQQAKTLSLRLRDGDFQVGDHIQLIVQGDTALRGTFTVERGLVLVLPNLPAISLQGILRSELHDRVVREVSQYLRNPQVTVTPLLRVLLDGEVAKPGFYYLTADTPLSDVLMSAGGPTPAASLSGSVVHRGGEEILSPRAVSDAFASGSTLDQLGLRGGDQLTIAQKHSSFNAMVLLQSLAVVSGILVTVVSLRHR